MSPEGTARCSNSSQRSSEISENGYEGGEYRVVTLYMCYHRVVTLYMCYHRVVTLYMCYHRVVSLYMCY